MNKLTQKFLVVSVLALAGCEHEANSGRLVGFIVDGQSGQRMNFFKADGSKNNLDDDKDSKNQVYAVIDGEFRRAVPCGSGDSNDVNGIEADGCYQIDGIPEGMVVPIFAQAEGYERFVGEFEYPLLDSDVEHAQYVGNIRLFPKGYTTNYRFQVSFNNQPVPKTQVICQYLATSGSSLQVSGNFDTFLTPTNTGTTTVTATAGDDGVATIPGDQLVNGATYHCEAVLNGTVDGRTLSGQANITAGVTQSEQSMVMTTSGSTDTLLYAMRSNADDPSVLLGTNGKLVITFNRPVEIVPGTADCQIATLNTTDVNGNSTTGVFPTNASGNNASETTTVEVSGDGLTVTIGFKTPTTPLDPGDIGTSVSFSGVVVKPSNASDLSQARYIGGLGVCPAVTGYSTSMLKNLRSGGNQNATIKLY